ncbi:MAG: PepSY domain-containing protein [Caulobacteraceae bacterium]|nr:PepSY domain-containing protein [Caulobacteraceae bacterium]
MIRSLLLTVAAAAALTGAAEARALPAGAAADAIQERRRFMAVQDPQAAIRNVERGRPGRRVGVRSEGPNIVVVWEYPGGRIAEIVVDARTGRILGER